MNLFNEARKWIATKANPANRALIVMGLSGPIFTQANYAAMAREGYVLNADVYACINEITRAAKGIKWQLLSGAGDRRKPVEDHELLDLIERPNPKTGWGAFFEQYIGYLMMSGNTYVVRNGPTNKAPTELWTLRPDRMKVDKGTVLDPIAGYTYSAGGTMVRMLPDNLGQTVLHTKLFHPLDDWYGLSPLEAACRNVDQSNEIQKWNVALMQNAARPSGALATDKDLSPEQFNRLEGVLREKFTGSQNAGIPLLLEGGLTWQKMSLTPAELDWLAGDERTTRKICSAFGVPPEMIGVNSGGALNDSSFIQARKKMYLETILPLMDFVRDEFNNWLTPLFDDGLYLDYDRDDIEAIQENRDIIWTRACTAVKSSIPTVNEGRKMVGLQALPGWDVILVPATVQLVDESGKVVLAASAAPTRALPAAAPPAKPTDGNKSLPMDRLLDGAGHIAGLLK
ncbi:MAG TPA: phage portal protein [Bryobacteraceae bacterium]|jgi:HK97 family phage portal protein|nr:phage portal protein [Bryobacteraceae bacterium]